MSKRSRKGTGDWKRKLLNAAVVCSLIVVLFFQVITLVAVHPDSIVNVPQAVLDATWLFPTLLTAVILIYAAVLLCVIWKKAEFRLLIPAALSIVGAAMALAVALTIHAAYDDVVGNDGAVALTDWEWFWQQCTLVIVPLVTTVVSIVRCKQTRSKRLEQEEGTYEEQFADDGFTLLGGEDVAKESGKKLSKKQRKERREKEESGN